MGEAKRKARNDAMLSRYWFMIALRLAGSEDRLRAECQALLDETPCTAACIPDGGYEAVLLPQSYEEARP